MTGKATPAVVTSAVLVLVVLLLPAVRAQAGCGCDHPPPSWATVMPPFGSPGAPVAIFADGGEFVPGETYTVEFGHKPALKVVAKDPNLLETSVPNGLELGPVAIAVKGPGYDRKYAEELFTALPPAYPVAPGTGKYLDKGHEVAIAADGTVLIPVDLGMVLDPTQFAMAFANLPLAFDQDDVAIYNADGVDLRLFTLEVDDSTQRQWGSYYGWEVEPQRYGEMSNVLTYWRHEFHTYAAAHAPGGSHELEKDGRHPDGTPHVDHQHLVIAVSGLERDKKASSDLEEAKRLAPGSRTVDLVWVSLVSPEPISLLNLTDDVAESWIGKNAVPLLIAKDDAD